MKLILSLFISLFSSLILSQNVNCDVYLATIEKEGEVIGAKDEMYFAFAKSDWLKSVVAYKIQQKIYVIADFKSDKFDLLSKKNIFCEIQLDNWNSYINPFVSGSEGEKFHKYIFENKCNCN